ncbi:lactose/L-arabinose transport system permease [Enterococcus sp. AZ194]|uniref:carbohydrate ABC transporter permease n=1 Tax=Enterococcus sp. AZ194 TaxID=2774629 RepID=UPI003F2242F1
MRKVRSIKKDFYGWFFISFAVILAAIFIVYPVISSFLMSFQSIKGFKTEFVGIDNYLRLFSDKTFQVSMMNSIFFLIVQVPIMLLLALLLASLLNSKMFRFKSFFRTAAFIPCVTSLVASSTLFKMIFANDGLINNVLLKLGLVSEQIPWLSHGVLAKIVIILVLLWRWTGYNMIFYLAAMQNIPTEIYEAAEIDGASKLKQFFHITIPNLKPIILVTAISSTIGTLQLFDEPMNLTKGGPGTATTTISQYIYNTSFVYSPNFGYAATLSYAIVLIVVILSIIQFRAGGKD